MFLSRITNEKLEWFWSLLEVIWTIRKKEKKRRRWKMSGSGWKLSMNDHGGWPESSPNSSNPNVVPFLSPRATRIILFRPDDIFLFVSVNKAPPRRRNKARSFLLSLETRFLFTLLRVLFNYNHDEMKS